MLPAAGKGRGLLPVPDLSRGRIYGPLRPYSFGMELRPAHRSIIRELSYEFDDEEWMKNRNDRKNGPLNIYEMHLGSWRRKGEGLNDFYSYEELIELLIPYVKESGYDYIEFLPSASIPPTNPGDIKTRDFLARLPDMVRHYS